MTEKRITYGDISEVLKSLGFERRVVPESTVAYRHPSRPGSLLLPVERAGTRALPVHVAMLKRLLIDFGFMSEEEADRWVANPKQFQAA